MSAEIAAVIPLFNGSKFIEEALRSVLSQTLLPTEIVVVDDGSTDESVEIVRKIAGEFASIRIVAKPNGGQSSARNMGVRESAAPLVALLDQDDIWYPTHLEELAQPFSSEDYFNLGWTYSDIDAVDEEGRMIVRNLHTRLRTSHPKLDLLHCLGQDMFILPSASLISRKAFEVVGGFDLRLSGYEDDDLFLRLFREGYQNVYLPKALSQWRRYSNSTSYGLRMARSRMIFMAKLREQFPDDLHAGLYYSRALIAPRFLRTLVAEYLRALRVGDRVLFDTMVRDLRTVIPTLGRRMRIIFSILLPFMSLYAPSRVAYRIGVASFFKRLF